MAEAQMEICLLWGDWQIQQWWSCMTKAEWLSLMQAISIIGAFGIAKWTYKKNRENDYFNKLIDNLKDEHRKLLSLAEDIAFFINYTEFLYIRVGSSLVDREFIKNLNAPDEYRLTQLPGVYYKTGISGWKYFRNKLVHYYFNEDKHPNVNLSNETIETAKEFLIDFCTCINMRIATIELMIAAAEKRKPSPKNCPEGELKPIETYEEKARKKRAW
nr:hypothetical protein [uncultured Comamonas sp.]